MFKELFFSSLVACALIVPHQTPAQTISTNLYGQNAHLPDYIGNQNWNGAFYNNVQNVKASKAKVIRWGGNFVDRPTNGFTTTAQYLKFIDSCRLNGMEPIITIPSDKSGFTSTDAANVVSTINGTYNKGVVYWIIGNEPNLYSPAYSTTAIANYIKSFSIAMRNASPIAIKIIAPEYAGYSSSAYGAYLGGADNIAGTNGSGQYYVDIISFHHYPMGNMNTSPADRHTILGKLRATGGFEASLIDLNTKVATVNQSRTANPLKIVVTEANMCYLNNTSSTELAPNGLNSNNTFIAGQFWVDMIQICMQQQVEMITFWSTIEGCSSCGDASGYATSLGYIHPNSWTADPGGKKPTYYHYQMVAENFNGNYCAGSSTLTNVRCFGAKNNSQVAVMIMNMDGSLDHNNFTLDLNNTTGGVKINAGINRQHTFSIPDQTTMMLIFNLSGDLIRQCVYNQTDAVNKVAPSCTTYTPCTPPTATASSNGTVCESQTIQLSANTVTGATYSWTGPDGWTNNTEDPQRTGAADYMGGTYTLVITLNGCSSAPATTTVTVPQFATVTPSGSASSCTSVLLSGPNGYTYQWKKDGNNITGANSQTYTATTSGSYQLKATNGSCSDWSAPVTVTIGGSVAAPTAWSNSPVCQSETIELHASTISGATYNWAGPGGWTATGQNPTRTGAATTMEGTYTVTATVGSCTSSPATTYVDIPDFASIGVATSTTFCANQSRSCWLYASDGDYSYQWIKNGTNITNATQDAYQATSSGSYQVRITRNSDGCMAWSAPVNVTATTSHVATITPAGPTTVCSPATVVLCGNGCNNYSYQWQKRDQNGNFQIIPNATSINYTVTTTGDYQLRTEYNSAYQWSSPVYCTINTGCRVIGEDSSATHSPMSSLALNIAPNPVNDVFSVSLNGMNETSKDIRIDVIDATGRLVQSATYSGITAPDFTTQIAIDENNGNGVYIVQVVIGEAVLHERILLAR